jgi:drug/metabolite transporter (DMT)-like permease
MVRIRGATRNLQSDDGRRGAVLSTIAAMVGFGVVPIFLRQFARDLDFWTVNGIRYSAGAIFWLPFLLLLQRRPAAGDLPAGSSGAADSENTVPEEVAVPGDNPGDPFPPGSPPDSRGPDRVWRDAVVPSVVNILGQVGFGASPYLVLASTLGFVTRLSFLFTIVFGFAFLAEERLLARQRSFWHGVAISSVGVAFFFLEKLKDGGRSEILGLVIVVFTAAAYAGYGVAVRRYMARYPVRQSFAVISLYTSAALVLLMLCFGNLSSIQHISPALWANLMLSALVGIAFGHVLYYRGIHRLGPVVSSGIMLATPFVTYLGAAVFLGERLSRMELGGGALVVIGGALLVAARARAERRGSRPHTAA